MGTKALWFLAFGVLGTAPVVVTAGETIVAGAVIAPPPLRQQRAARRYRSHQPAQKGVVAGHTSGSHAATPDAGLKSALHDAGLDVALRSGNVVGCDEFGCNDNSPVVDAASISK